MVEKKPFLRSIQVIRYVMPLREGGSLPAIAEGDDGFLYVLKFRGAGQGVKVLIAELIAGEIARLLGLKIPEIVFADLDHAFGRSEQDEEIQDLLRASEGKNLALHFLTGSITYDPLVMKIDDELASKIVWLDCLITNVDRTAKNTNMLMWNKELWLIDHGASFYFHHHWQNWEEQAQKPFSQIKDHVLLAAATLLEQVDKSVKSILTKDKIQEVVSLIPDEWLLTADSPFQTAEEYRSVYSRFLEIRLSSSQTFVNEAQNARKALI